MASITTSEDVPSTARAWVEHDLRRLAAVATAGLLLGFVINGWGSRAAMLLLARLNPDATGVISDDGFRIGQFGLAETASLLLFATALGVLGGVLFLVLRGLRFGPRWFQVASMAVGPAVVIGAQLVHTGGVDFTLLRPTWLAIALFVALPGLFGWAMARLGDAWLAEDSWFMTGSRARLLALLPLVLAAPAAPLLFVLGVGLVLHHGFPTVRRVTTHPVATFVARAGVTAVFLVALVDLVRDTAALT